MKTTNSSYLTKKNILLGLAVMGMITPIAASALATEAPLVEEVKITEDQWVTVKSGMKAPSQDYVRGLKQHENFVTYQAPQRVYYYNPVTIIKEEFQDEFLISNESSVITATDKNVTSSYIPSNRERESVITENLETYKGKGLTRELAETIHDVAKQFGVDPDLAYGLVNTESSFKNSATSPVGAIGLTQLMPATARYLQPDVTMSELRNPDTNLKLGFKFFKDMLKKYDGDVELALTAYNRGPGTVDKVLKKGGDPDNGYADMVFSMFKNK